MASRTPKKRARIDAAAAKDSTSSGICTVDVGSSQCQPSTPPNSTCTDGSKTGWCSGSTTAGDGSVPTSSTQQSETPRHHQSVGQLHAELESARRCVEQLRREKNDESKRAREQSDAALRQLAERLRDERQRVIEQVRERYAAESSRASERHEREIQRLRDELERCRAELLRAQCSDGNGGESAERARLLQKVALTTAAKRQADEALRRAVETDRQKSAEIRRLHGECRAEVARVSKDANVQIRRLLDELKMKDHQLALLDRNQCPDRGAAALLPVKLMQQPQQHGDCCMTTNDQQADAAAAPASARSDRTSKHADLLQAETIATLQADVERLTAELKASEADRTSMKHKLNQLNNELLLRQHHTTATATDRIQTASQTDSQDEKRIDADPKHGYSNIPTKPQAKAVRFLLPGETLPVLARETPTLDDDGDASVNSDDVSDTASLASSSSSSSSLRLSPDSTTLYDESIVKNYHLLLSEHLSLQRNVANLLTSWSQTSPVGLPVLPSHDANTTCRQDCANEKESLKSQIVALKDKLCVCKATEHELRQQLKEQQEQNEELEFRLFELEESSEKVTDAEGECSAVDLVARNQSLEVEVTMLRQKLAETSHLLISRPLPLEDALLPRLSCDKATTTISHNNREIVPHQQQTDGSLLVIDVFGEKVVTKEGHEDSLECVETVTETVVETVVDGGSESTTKDLEDDEQLAMMTCSMSSATSGFDDNSCASSVVGSDEEMPSEETWNFNVTEEASCVGLAAAARPASSEQSDASAAPTVTDQQVKQMERIWLSRMEKLQRRLMRAVEGEQRARDQMALLSEEKDRRIAVLEQQVDILEADEFRQSKTIQTLQQLERVFTTHFVELHGGENKSHGDQTKIEQVGERMIDDVVGHPCCDRICLQCHACQTLKNTVELLHSALAEQSEVNRRVRELEQGVKDSQSPDTSDHDAYLEVVDFEAEYHELEVLFKELKQVLVVDRSADGCSVITDSSALTLGEGDKDTEREDRKVLSLPLHWNPYDDVAYDDDDETVSMVITPDLEIDAPALRALKERNRELEISEQYLRQQISDLEMERDQLRDVVRGGEATIDELGASLAQLQTTEKSVSDEVSRLRAKNDWMAGRIDGLLELVGRLEEADRVQRAAASELKLRAERHSAGEVDLRRELDNALDEHELAEIRCRRWVSQLEHERDILTARVDELTDRNAELEGREAALECRVRKLETTEHGLRAELADLERTLADQQGDIFDERLLTAVSFTSNYDDDDDDDCQYSERVLQNNSQTTGVIAFLKQKLERSDRRNIELEDRLSEKTACEERLRATVEELEKSDGSWREKVVSMETQKKLLQQKIDDLQTELTNVKNMMWRRSSAPAVTRGLLTLDPLTEVTDDVELSYWEVVEQPTTHDHCDESALTSPYWATVEQIMRLSTEVGEEKETFAEDSSDKTLVGVRNFEEDSSPEDAELSLPLCVSPSPDEKTAFISEEASGTTEQYESMLSVLLKSTSQKPEVERLFSDRKLVVIRAADIHRSRSADIFRADSTDSATSGPATARAQSETRDLVTDSCSALSTTTLAVENLTSLRQDGDAEHVEQQQQLAAQSEDEELKAMSNVERQTNHYALQTGSGSGNAVAAVVRRSLIPRIALTSLSAQTHGTSGSSEDDRRTPTMTMMTVLSSPRSLIPRPVADNRSGLSSASASNVDATRQEPATGVETHQVKQDSCVSSQSSCYRGDSNFAPASRD